MADPGRSGPPCPRWSLPSRGSRSGKSPRSRHRHPVEAPLLKRWERLFVPRSPALAKPGFGSRVWEVVAHLADRHPAPGRLRVGGIPSILTRGDAVCVVPLPHPFLSRYPALFGVQGVGARIADLEQL